MATPEEAPPRQPDGTLLTGQLLLLDHRLQRVESRLEAQEARLQALEAHHQHYIESVQQLRLHFDGELADLKETHTQLVGTVVEVRGLVGELNTMLRVDDTDLSLRAWRKITDTWIASHVATHGKVEERSWRVSLDLAAKALWVLLATVALVALAVLGRGAWKP